MADMGVIDQYLDSGRFSWPLMVTGVLYVIMQRCCRSCGRFFIGLLRSSVIFQCIYVEAETFLFKSFCFFSSTIPDRLCSFSGLQWRPTVAVAEDIKQACFINCMMPLISACGGQGGR
jgi:hypothetical protein